MHKHIRRNYQNKIPRDGANETKIFESIRGVFTEGGPIFEGANILEKSHIQICIRNPDCIKGFFNPRESTPFEDWINKNVA